MPDTYPIADLTMAPATLEARSTVDPARIARELRDVTDAIAPVLADADAHATFGLHTVELALTIGAEGGVWFVAKGSAEASIKLTFSRGDA